MENNRCLICNQELVIQFDLAQFLIPVLNKQRRTQSVNDGGVLIPRLNRDGLPLLNEKCLKGQQ